MINKISLTSILIFFSDTADHKLNTIRTCFSSLIVLICRNNIHSSVLHNSFYLIKSIKSGRITVLHIRFLQNFSLWKINLPV